MRTFGICLSMVLLAGISYGANAATRIEPIHPERENVPPSIRRELIFEDLDKALSGPVSPVSIATGPYLSNRDGLCQRDVIYLRYQRSGDGERKGPFRPVGIAQVATEYHRLGYGKAISHDRWIKACSELASEKVYWARSESEYVADFALASLEIAVADVRRNALVTVDCEELSDSKIEARCAAEFMDSSPNVTAMRRCYDKSDGVRVQCWTLDMAGYEVTIVRDYSRIGSEPYSTTITMRYKQIIMT